MEKDIKNKIIVVTGASRGIGYGIAHTFLQEGAKNVIILDIDEEVGNKAAATLNTKFGSDKAIFFKCDVTTDLDTVFERILDKFKSIDVLVNNAGVFDEYSIRKTIAVNTTALVEWTMKFWEHARKDRGGDGGTVINISSPYGYLVDPFAPFYKTSKHAVIGFTRTIGHRMNNDRTGVRVIAFCPGFTRTILTETIQLNENQEFQKDKFNDFMKKNSWSDVDDMSQAIADMFKKADSGTVWAKLGDVPLTEVPVPAEFLSENLINDVLYFNNIND